MPSTEYGRRLEISLTLASKASWAEPAAWTQLNSGVIVWSSRAITKKLWQRWIALYCSESSTKDFNGGDQHFLSQALLRMVREDRLQLYQLLPQWNFRSWRRHFANGPKCCEARPAEGAATDPVPIYVDHGCHKDSYYLGLPQAAHVAKLRHNATAAFFGHMVR